MSKSIIQENEVCYICNSKVDLHRHHIFYGTANRKLSEKYGLKICLCGKHHNLSNEGIHFDKNLDLKIKKLAQKRFEKVYPELEFIKIFGRNYL